MIITKNDLKKINIPRFIGQNYLQLIGSAIFTKHNGLLSNTICFFTKKTCDDKKEFIPSHVGSIYSLSGELYILDVKPPINRKQKLINYLMNTTEDYVLFVREFPLNPCVFNREMIFYENKPYGMLSAVQSIFTKLEINWGKHCSEVYLEAIQQHGILSNINANKSTPHSLLHLLEQM